MSSSCDSLDAPRPRTSPFSFMMVFITALSLSIGWGVRGNFGHEYGAMLPGCLAAIAVCLLSGREDWRPRVHYFAFFGALGWGFGASISYMQVLAYSHSGHAPTQYYALYALFLIGFVWAGLGGAGTALPAVLNRKRLTDLFVPLCFVFALWTIIKYGEDPLIGWYKTHMWGSGEGSSSMLRQKNPFYWFDSDWLKALTALIGLCLFDLWDRTFVQAREQGDVNPMRGVRGFVTYLFAGLELAALGLWILRSLDATYLPLTIAKAIAYPVLDTLLPFETRDAIITTIAANRTAAGLTIGALVGIAFYLLQFAHVGTHVLAIELLWLGLYAIIAMCVGLLVQSFLLGNWIVLAIVGLAVLLAIAILARRLYAVENRGTITHLLRCAVYSVAAVLVITLLAVSFGSFAGKGLTGYGFRDLIVRPQGVVGIVPLGGTEPVTADNLLNNWPQFFEDIAQHLGWVFGLAAGIAIYFYRRGTWRKDSGLFVYMAAGWLISFLILPTLLGIRMTPPRGDDWAGILGVWCGAMAYCMRNGMGAVAYTSLVSAFVGGLAFPSISFLQGMLRAPGHTKLITDKLGETPEATELIQQWSFYNSANWHSFLEQSYGFVNGLAIALALGMLATRLKKHDEPVEPCRPKRWTEAFSVFFILVVLTYVNMEKNVVVWVSEGPKVIPEFMRMPLIGWHDINVESWFRWSAWTWFNVTYFLFGAAVLAMLVMHLRRGLALIPKSWLGRGELFYVIFLWLVVIFNFERALTGFAEQRVLTEWVIMVNAVIATLGIVLAPREGETLNTRGILDFTPGLMRTFVVGVIATVTILTSEFLIIREVYGDNVMFYSNGGRAQKRFGDEAEWRIVPLLKNKAHN